MPDIKHAIWHLEEATHHAFKARDIYLSHEASNFLLVGQYLKAIDLLLDTIRMELGNYAKAYPQANKFAEDAKCPNCSPEWLCRECFLWRSMRRAEAEGDSPFEVPS